MNALFCLDPLLGYYADESRFAFNWRQGLLSNSCFGLMYSAKCRWTDSKGIRDNLWYRFSIRWGRYTEIKEVGNETYR